MREEVLVLGRQDGLTQDNGHLVVGDHPPVLPRQLDQHLALGVVDLARRGRLETDESRDVGEPAMIEVDMVDESRREEKKKQRQGSGHEDRDAAQPCGWQAAGRKGTGALQPRGHASSCSEGHCLGMSRCE